MRISSASVGNRGTAKQVSRARRFRKHSLHTAAGQPGLSVLSSVLFGSISSCFASAVSDEGAKRYKPLALLTQQNKRCCTFFLLLCRWHRTGLGGVTWQWVVGGSCLSALGLALGAQPFALVPCGWWGRWQDGRACSSVCVLSLHFYWGWMASLGGVLCAECCCVSGLCLHQPGPSVSAGAGLLAPERGCWTPGTRWLPLAHTRLSGLSSSPASRGTVAALEGQPLEGRTSPAEGRRDGAGGSRLARRLPARDWIGVRWRLGKLCEPVFGGGVGCGPQLLGRNGAGPPRAAPGPRVCYQGAQLWVWWVEAWPRTEVVMICCCVSGLNSELPPVFLSLHPWTNLSWDQNCLPL